MAKNSAHSTKKPSEAKDSAPIAADNAVIVAPAEPMRPSIGRTVLFVLPLDKSAPHASGQEGVTIIRPAIVTHVYDPAGEKQYINLNVLVDGRNDGFEPGVTAWKTSVYHDQEGKSPNTWHWMAYQQGQAAKTDAIAGDLRAQVKQLLDESARDAARITELEARPIAGAPPAAPKPPISHQ